MEGPKAPRDTGKMRPYFYILKDKEIFGSKQEDGTGIQFVYESDGRLINSAQIAGNITDQEETGFTGERRRISKTGTQHRNLCGTG